MLDISKEEIIKQISQNEDVIFVGGTSEYIQGIKNELNDIDISVKNTEFLNKFGYVHKNFNNSLYGLSGNRGFIKTKNFIIDIFIDDKRPDYIIINRKKCETLDSMIELREKTLEYDLIKDEFFKKKNYNNLIRLKKWKQLQQ